MRALIRKFKILTVLTWACFSSATFDFALAQSSNDFISICDRSEPVVQAIRRAVFLAPDCDKFKKAHLLSIDTLVVSDSDDIELRDGDFSDLNNLRVLILVNTYLGPTGFRILESLTQLEQLKFSNFDSLRFPPKFFSRFPRLRALTIGFSGISSVPEEVRNLKNLTRLSLFRNEIASIPDDFFTAHSELETLILSGNFDLVTTPRMFGRLSKLNHLDISGTRSRYFSLDWLPNPVLLRNLNLSGLQIVDFPRHFFARSPFIEHLDISNNKFESVSAEVFENLDFLKVVQMGSSSLNTVHDDTFINNRMIREVDVSDSPLTDTRKSAFRGVPKVTGLPADFDVPSSQDSWQSR